jgi:hypothetical protein
MNRNRFTIDGQFTRRNARKNLGYKRIFFKLLETQREDAIASYLSIPWF